MCSCKCTADHCNTLKQNVRWLHTGEIHNIFYNTRAFVSCFFSTKKLSRRNPHSCASLAHTEKKYGCWRSTWASFMGRWAQFVLINTRENKDNLCWSPQKEVHTLQTCMEFLYWKKPNQTPWSKLGQLVCIVSETWRWTAVFELCSGFDEAVYVVAFAMCHVASFLFFHTSQCICIVSLTDLEMISCWSEIHVH